MGRRWVKQAWSGVLWLVVVLAGAGCRGTPVEPTQRSRAISATAKFAQAAAAATGQTARMATDYERGRFVGFDTHTFPGVENMRAWKKTPGSPYKWVGFYLPAPCHSDTSWVGTRDTLVAMGWGLAVIYVGQQTWGRTPRRLTAAQRAARRAKTPCSADLLSREEGILNADDAVKRASREGFPRGAVIFLDLERTERIPPAMREYYRAWVARMLQTGVYRPGIYVHQHNAPTVFRDVQAEFRAAGDTSTPRFWIAGGKNFQIGRAPQDVGFAFAGVWQGVLDVARSIADVRLPIDINVSAWRSPSESGIALE